MSKITGNIELDYEGEKITYVLSVGIDVYKNTKYMPSLSFYENYGMIEGEKMLSIWDNDNYLIETLLPKVLVPWIENKSIIDTENFAELLQVKGVVIYDFPYIKELLDKGIEMGFFEEYSHKKEIK
jgi:hypothetical protein